jgi:Ca2+-binding RTX toxin-like protein
MLVMLVVVGGVALANAQDCQWSSSTGWNCYCERDPNLLCLGTNNVDYIWGSPSSDRIYGYGGDDDIFGYDQNDLIDGGSGYDRCDGGPGFDRARNCQEWYGIEGRW